MSQLQEDQPKRSFKNTLKNTVPVLITVEISTFQTSESSLGNLSVARMGAV